MAKSSKSNQTAGNKKQDDEVTAEVAKENPATGTPLARIEMPGVSISVDHIRSSQTEPVDDPRLVEVKVSYPENYKGKRFLKDGSTIKVSPETAGRFEELGIASKV